MTESRALKIIENLKSKYTGEELKIRLLTYAIKYSYRGTRYISNIFYKEVEKI